MTTTKTTCDPKSIPTPASALSPEEVREFERIVREETGLALSDQDAWNRAIELMALVRMLIRPDPEDLGG